jgi:hypothetical protein
MATIPYTITGLQPGSGHNDVMLVTWPNMANGDVGQAFQFPAYADRSAQLRGTLGAGGNARIEGSNILGATNSADYDPLTDPQGNALDLNTLKTEQVSEVTLLIRPRITAGDGTTSLTVSMLAVRRK